MEFQHSSLGSVSEDLSDNFDAAIVHPCHKGSFIDSLAFFVLYFAFVAVLGSILGLVLALRT
jgi:hypothetical protein